jgi:hypothetical protein
VEAFAYSTGQRHSEFLYGRFLDVACASLYGERAAPSMAALFRLERDKGPIVPVVAWIDSQHRNAAYDWRGQADRNREARALVDRAAAVCESRAKADLMRLSGCLEVAARICMLADAVHREKPGKAEIEARAEKLLAWMDHNYSFQVAEPDGGDAGFWKATVRHIREAYPK